MDDAARETTPALPEWIPTGVYIKGWHERETFAVENPATREILAHVSNATRDDVHAALDAAEEGLTAMASLSPRQRAELLRRLYEEVIARSEDLALTMTLEMGKTLTESRGEAVYAAEFLRWFSEEACRIEGDYLRSPEGTQRFVVLRRPVGICLLITPWNFPLAMLTRKIGPALAAGCSVVIKPAPTTPLTALAFAKICEDVGVPAGAVSVLPTTDADAVSEVALADRRVRKLSFTGSTRVGSLLLEKAARNVVRTSMELGGLAPVLVCEDANLDLAIPSIVHAKLRNSGQACNAADRIFVHASIAEEFTARLAEAMSAKTAEPGWGSADLGPLNSAQQYRKVHGLVSRAIADGAALRAGSLPEADPEGGWFFPPIVLGGCRPEMEIMNEEIFGPVAPIGVFKDDAEALERANETPFGLAAYVYTENMDRAFEWGEKIEAGMISINAGTIANAAAPFGGVKASGLGREGSREGIEEYLETVYLGFPVR